jgi:hypothetical protein
MRKIILPLAILIALILATPVSAAGSFQGTISSQGYQPPNGVTVIWRIAGAGDINKKLDPSIQFTSLGDSAGFFCRYAECDTSVVGRQIVPYVTSEHGGGEGFAILQELFRQSGLSRDPSLQEAFDWMIANGNGKALFSCGDFLQYTGKARPGCQDIAPSGGTESKLRPQPNDPAGCCNTSLPCIVRNEKGRTNGEEWTEAVSTPQGGRKGCRLRNLTEGEPPPVEPPPVKPPPAPECQPCSPIDAVSCDPFSAPIRASLSECEALRGSCGSELKVLASRARELEAENARLKATPSASKPNLSADALAILRKAKPSALARVGVRAQYNRTIREICAQFKCPVDLR